MSFSDRSGQLQLWKIRVDGSELQQITGIVGEGQVAAWSPDGSELAFTTAATDPDQNIGNAFIMNVQDTEEVAVRLPPGLPPDTRFVPNSWSLDGRRLVGQASYEQHGVTVYDLQTQTYDRLTEFGEWPVLLPDRRRVHFVLGGREFHTVDRITRRTTRIFSVLRGTLGPPRLTLDGREMYLSRRTTESDVWIATLERQVQ